MTKRVLSGYEINRLLKFGKYPLDLDRYKETPVEYITGFAEFMGREFAVNADVLIPRIETQELAEKVIFTTLKLPKNQSTIQIADIGTGSGSLGISIFCELLEKNRDVRMWLSDISSKALVLAKQNMNHLVPSAAQKNIEIITSNLLLDFPPSFEPTIIVANLPYLPSDVVMTLDNSVKDYEPHTALDGGSDGLVIVRELMEQIKKFPFPPLYIFLEVDDFCTDKNLPSVPHYSLKIEQDQFKKVRFAIYEYSS